MATLQKDALFIGKDKDGNKVLLYPITMMDNVDGLQAALDSKAAKPTFAEMTMKASGWNKTAKTYSFESSYPAAQYDIAIQPNKICSTSQLDAYMSAMIMGSVNSNVVTAAGEVPAVDIPIIIKVVVK